MSNAATASIMGREQARRQDGKRSSSAKMSTPGFIGVTNQSSNGLNLAQINAIDRLFNTHPAVTAARSVLHSQLFSGGVALFRDGKAQGVVKDASASAGSGKRQATTASSSSSSSSSPSSQPPTRAPSEAGDVPGDDSSGGVKETFNKHLQGAWLEFARDVCDSFLKWGFAVVTFELEEEESPIKRAARLAKIEEKMAAPEGKRRGGTEGSSAKRLIPKVPTLGTYQVGFDYVGRFGYTRRYSVYPTVPGQTNEADQQTVVFIRTEPDEAGNCNSPLASVYELGSFVHSLTELAMVAEISRATPQIVTQLRPPVKTNGLDPGALFFDQESRNVASGQATEESQSAAHALEMQANLCRIINRLQTSGPREQGGSGSSFASTQPPPKAHTIEPHLFCIPKGRSTRLLFFLSQSFPTEPSLSLSLSLFPRLVFSIRPIFFVHAHMHMHTPISSFSSLSSSPFLA